MINVEGRYGGNAFSACKQGLGHLGSRKITQLLESPVGERSFRLKDFRQNSPTNGSPAIASGVESACQISKLIESATKRTLLSASSKLTPPG